MTEGGLNAVFFAVYVGQSKRTPENYKKIQQEANGKFEAIHRMADEMYPDKIELAYSPDDVERIHASGKLVVWESAATAMPILAVPEDERRAALRAALEPDWHRSEWVRREIVQGDDEKVHVVTRFVRLRADGSVIKTFDSLYVMTRERGRWAIKGRSSFAP